jgi:hypothetical protein
MAENKTIEAPDFEEIKRETGPTTKDAVVLLWAALNDVDARQRRGVRVAKDVDSPAVKTDAPAADQHNYDTGDVGIVLFTGSTNFSLTGIRNGRSGRTVTLVNLGTATITLPNSSVSSDAANRLLNDGGASTSLTTDKTARYRYLDSRWREESLA